MAPSAEEQPIQPSRRESEASRITRRHIIEAALRLFARNGIDAVSLREISRAAGLRNVGGVQYHFTTKENLIRAILASRSETIESRRLEALDDLERRRSGNLRDLLEAFLTPMADLLKGDQHDRAFLVFLFQVHFYSGPLFPDLFGELQSEAAARVYAAIAGHLPDLPRESLSRRFDFMMAFVMSALERRVRGVNAGSVSPRTHNRFFADLLDSSVGVLMPPASESPASPSRSAP